MEICLLSITPSTFASFEESDAVYPAEVCIVTGSLDKGMILQNHHFLGYQWIAGVTWVKTWRVKFNPELFFGLGNETVPDWNEKTFNKCGKLWIMIIFSQTIARMNFYELFYRRWVVIVSIAIIFW